MSGSNVSRRAFGMAGAGAGIAAIGAAAQPAEAGKRCRKLPEAVYVPVDRIVFEPAAVGNRLAQGIRAVIATTGSGFLFAADQSVTETSTMAMLPELGSADTLIYRIAGTPGVLSGGRQAATPSLACSIQVLSAEMDRETGIVTIEGVLLDAAGDVAAAGYGGLPDLDAATIVALRQPSRS